MDIQKVLDSIKTQVAAQQQEAIRKAVEKEMQNLVIDEKNISPNLIQKFMTSQSNIQIPPPERKNLPSLTNREDISDLLDVDVDDIYMDLMVGNNVYLYGKAGTGKTELAKKVCVSLLERNYQLLNCNQFTSPINIIGGQTIEGYKQGQLSIAWEKGEVLILDELPKLDPNTAGLLNEALAQSAAVDKAPMLITKEEYEEYEKEMLGEGEDGDGEPKYLGYELMEEGGQYYIIRHITITDGKGDKIRKHKDFAVIGTGNTNLKDAPANFSGNNRQDYSLVDRFSGSMYKIGQNVKLEKKYIFTKVYKICSQLRTYLESDESTVESVSFRTMLNFNRIYEQQGLREIDANEKYIIKPIIVNGKPKAKTLKDCVQSFLDVLPSAKKTDILSKMNLIDIADEDIDTEEFVSEFIRIYGFDPYTGEPVVIEPKP